MLQLGIVGEPKAKDVLFLAGVYYIRFFWAVDSGIVHFTVPVYPYV